MILREKILFSKEECETILSYRKTNVTNWKMKDRKYESQPIHYSLETKWLFTKLKNFFEIETSKEIVNLKKTIHFHKFLKDDWFGEHNDVRDSRAYSVGVLLNDNFEGGEFKLYNPEELKISKVTGNTYLFDVRIQHEITPIIKDERYSLLWFLQNENIKVKTTKLI